MRLYSQNGNGLVQESGLGANSLALTEACFVSETWGVVSKATSSTKIAWVTNTLETFASDNQTVAQRVVQYTLAESGNLYEVAITWGTITSADKWKYYDLSDSVTVDGTTESTTPYSVDTSEDVVLTWEAETVSIGSTSVAIVVKQLKLVKYISATLGVFKIVSLD